MSLTSIVCMICDKVIKKQWIDYLVREGIISVRQFGFRTGRSCVTNLSNFYSRVINITKESDGWVDCLYLNLKKAFNKVPPRRLLWELEYIGGLKGTLRNWIKDYLKGREMRTIIKNDQSEWKEVNSEVP